jgi:MFS superfamily sulfate permease-like transporter
MHNSQKFSLNTLKGDLSAGLSVFLVALPLCLGIALASGAPLLSGLLAGIVGGLVVSVFSGSQVSVSGPAAGLTVVILNAIHSLGNFQSFLCAVILSGIIQIGFSFLSLGFIADFVPTAVIQGMLAAIGLVIILKQIPHALGSDYDYNGDFSFISVITDKNSFDEIIFAIDSIENGALLISTFSLLILVVWENFFKSGLLKAIPPSLVVVIFGAVVNWHYANNWPALYLSAEGNHLVRLTFTSLKDAITLPDLTAVLNFNVILTAATIAIVASVESLLSIEASDKLDPYKRISNPNKELFAQGLGNICSGLIGGLPVTSVVVRTSANIYAGSKTWLSSFFHGLFLFLALLTIPQILNLIPLSCLSAILILIGFKLCKPKIFIEMYKSGYVQFIPFLVTIVSILISDLLTGVLIGILVGLFFVLKATHHSAFTLVNEGKLYLLRFNKDVSFINKAELKELLLSVPEKSSLIIDGIKAVCIDHDIKDVIRDFRNSAKFNSIDLEIKHISL